EPLHRSRASAPYGHVPGTVPGTCPSEPWRDGRRLRDLAGRELRRVVRAVVRGRRRDRRPGRRRGHRDAEAQAARAIRRAVLRTEELLALAEARRIAARAREELEP